MHTPRFCDFFDASCSMQCFHLHDPSAIHAAPSEGRQEVVLPALSAPRRWVLAARVYILWAFVECATDAIPKVSVQKTATVDLPSRRTGMQYHGFNSWVHGITGTVDRRLLSLPLELAVLT